MKYTSPLIKEILKSESAKRALDRISPIYMDSKIGLWMLESIGTELDELRNLTQDMTTQILPQTTTWAIDYWEKEYGISVNKDLPLEQIRRPRLLNKIRARAPMNPQKLVSLIKTEINNQSIPIEITENVHKNTFRIMITPGSFHTDWKQVFKLVDRVKPAHVIYFIIMYDLSKFYVPIEINSILNILSDFYVRKGNYPWYLNGNIFIDGNFYLNGYKDSEIIDYYPLNLLIRDYVNVDIDFLWRLKYPSSFIVDIDESSKLRIISNFEVRHIPNHLYIDGSWQIDGKYNINGYDEDTYPDYYPIDLLIRDYIITQSNLFCNIKYNFNFKVISNNNNKINIITNFETGHQLKPYQLKMLVKNDIKADTNINSKLTANINLWHLDGSAFLDGEYGLNPSIITYNI